MSYSPEQIAYISARTLVRRLFESGVEHFCVSPGYRNSPLVLALSKFQGVQIHSHIDERGAAFFALGLAKALGKPTAVICTSGTAAANYMPAVLEAFYSHVPMVVVTADRPHELLGVGANQSMDQFKLFGAHARFFASIPALQNFENSALENIHLLAAKAVSQSLGPVPGPVHLNIAFREPFFLKDNAIDELEGIAESFSPSWLAVLNSRASPMEDELKKLAAVISSKEKILIAVGPCELRADEASGLISLARKLRAPIFAEPSSGLGFASGADNYVCSRFEIFLSYEDFAKSHKPDLILRYGPALTSKRFAEFQVKNKIPIVVIDQCSETRNPQYGEAYYCAGAPPLILASLEKILATKESASGNKWMQSMLQKNKQSDERLQQYLSSEFSFTEWHISRELSERLPNNSVFFVGNSMPIRDFDAVAAASEKSIQVFSNRGLSGIDGVISTALGVAVASQKSVTLLLGDISALHDINALSLAKRLSASIRVTMFIVNNQGGEIFRMVPTGDSHNAEKLFTTPQNLDFSQLAAGFGIPFQRWNSIERMREKFSEVYDHPGVKLIELVPNAARNTNFRKEFWKRLKE